MPEPVTTVGLGAVAAYLGKDGLQKLLGPTAEYLGGGLKDFTQKRAETIGRIFEKAADRLGPKIDAEGGVPPKVLKQIIDDGSFATEELEIDYLAGVLASSRSDNIRDNRGASIAATVNSLSNYQLRAHYILYSALRSTFADSGIEPDMAGRPRLKTFVTFECLWACMNLDETEAANWGGLVPHIFFGLNREGLIGNFQYGASEKLSGSYPGATADGVVFEPSPAGIELYLWAFGAGGKELSYIFSGEFTPIIDDATLKSVHGAPAAPESKAESTASSP